MSYRKLPDPARHHLPKEYRGVLAGFAFAAALLAGGCSRGEPPPFVAIEHEISPLPARIGASTFTLRLTDTAGKPVTGAHIGIEADMTHAGMSPVFAAATERGAGRYEAHLEFPMAGDWVILLHVTLPGGKRVERQIDVKGVRPN